MKRDTRNSDHGASKYGPVTPIPAFSEHCLEDAHLEPFLTPVIVILNPDAKPEG